MNNLLQTPSQITAWLERVGVENYTLQEDAQYGWVVDVMGGVVLENLGLQQLPVKFNRVTGSFSCRYNQLTSLLGAPHTVGGSFDCNHNCLTSLQYAPVSVGHGFYCDHNDLRSLRHCPQTLKVFSCVNNFLTSLTGGPKEVINYSCKHNRLTTLRGAPKNIDFSFDCSQNLLTSLQFCPQRIQISFMCGHNRLLSLEFCPDRVGGVFSCHFNPGLGGVQDITDFKEIYKIHEEIQRIKAEKNLIHQTLLPPTLKSNNPLAARHKI